MHKINDYATQTTPPQYKNEQGVNVWTQLMRKGRYFLRSSLVVPVVLLLLQTRWKGEKVWMRTGPDCDYDKQTYLEIFTQIYVTVNQCTVAILTLSLGTLGLVAFPLAAALYQRNHDRNHKQWHNAFYWHECRLNKGSLVQVVVTLNQSYINISTIFIEKK